MTTHRKELVRCTATPNAEGFHVAALWRWSGQVKLYDADGDRTVTTSHEETALPVQMDADTFAMFCRVWGVVR